MEGKIRQLALIILVIWLFSYSSSQAVAGNGRGRIPTYTVIPSYAESNLNQSVKLTVSLVGGQADTRYSFNITVTKPDIVSKSLVEYEVTTDGNGYGTRNVSYPSGFHDANAQPATNQVGTYVVRVDQILPKYSYGVAASSFMISPNLSLNILSPRTGAFIDRGSNVSLTVLVKDINGNSQSNANVTAALPRRQNILEIPETQQLGIYAASYQVRWSDPSGLWNIEYVATDASGNKGEASAVVNITSTALSIQKLVAFGSSGQSRLTFYNNDTVNFQVEADYPDGSSPASGAASVEILNPVGRLQVTLALVYDPQINAYRTLTGYELNQTAMLGTWTATIYTNGLSDGFGNQGPLTPVSLEFNVAASPAAYGNSQNPVQISDAFNFLPFALLGIFGIVPVVALRRRNRAGKIDDLDQLIQAASTTKFTLIEGHKQTGKSTVCCMIAGRSAEMGQKVVLLSFENSPVAVRTRMLQGGVDCNELEDKGNLELIDCSDVAESVNIGYLRAKLLDALDGKGQRTTLLIDSLDLLFDDLEEKEVQDLFRALENEAQSLNGVLYATMSSDICPASQLSSLESIAGIVLQAEKSMGQEGLQTFLKVKKMARSTNEDLGDSLTIHGLNLDPINNLQESGKIS